MALRVASTALCGLLCLSGRASHHYHKLSARHIMHDTLTGAHTCTAATSLSAARRQHSFTVAFVARVPYLQVICFCHTCWGPQIR